MSQPSTAVTGKYDKLLATCRALSPLAAAVAWPCEESALEAAVEAAEAGLIRPVLVGPTDTIRSLADRLGIDVGPYALVDAPSSHATAAKAVELVGGAEAEILMKGSLHSDAFLAAVMEPETGLRTGAPCSAWRARTSISRRGGKSRASVPGRPPKVRDAAARVSERHIFRGLPVMKAAGSSWLASKGR